MTDWYLAGYERKVTPPSSLGDTTNFVVQRDGIFVVQRDSSQIVDQRP